jgi:dTDP-4-dehydrorhamnose reductase
MGTCVTPSRGELDLAKPQLIRNFVRHLKPEVIVNAGAYTAVDKAESDRDSAIAINADGPAALADEARRIGSLIVHYSTDYIFDGTKEVPYVETDAPAPLGAYGESKLRGENAVRSSGAFHVILRTSWVFGPTGSNFPRTMLRLSREREEIRVVDDQVGAPTSSLFLARSTAQIITQCIATPELGEERSGVYHLTASGKTTWYAFARAVLERDPHVEDQRVRRLIPISTSEYSTPATRPRCSLMDCSKIKSTFDVHSTSWTDQLDEVMARWVW